MKPINQKIATEALATRREEIGEVVAALMNATISLDRMRQDWATVGSATEALKHLEAAAYYLGVGPQPANF